MAKSRNSGSDQDRASKKAPAPAEPPFARLCLITPPRFDAAAFAPVLDAALASGEVASLIIAAEGLDPSLRLAAAERLVPIAQANGTAAIVTGDAALVLASGADGLHVDDGLPALRHAVDRFRPDRMVGAGGIRSRHEAMVLAETECDYLFFGRFDGDGEQAVHDKTLDLAAWWSALFEIPAIVMGGSGLDSVTEVAMARIEFVALRAAVWDHADGPAAAVAAASRLVLEAQAEAAP